MALCLLVFEDTCIVLDVCLVLVSMQTDIDVQEKL